MALEFHIPRRPEDLLNPQRRGLHVQEQVPYDSSLANSIVNDLRFKEASRIVEQDFFDGLFSVFRNFEIVQPDFKSALCDVFNENILIMASEVEVEKEPQMLERQCLKVFLFFLHWLWDVETGKDDFSLQKKGGGRKRKGGASEDSKGWDWRHHLHRSLQNFAGVTRIENKLEGDFAGSRERESSGQSVGHLCIKMVSIALRGEMPLKVAKIREEIVKVGACCVRNLQMGESTANELVNLLKKFEHVPEVIGEIAAKAESSGKDDMTREIVKAISANTADDLSVHWDITDGKSMLVKGIAKTIDALANHVPVSLKNHWSFLTPYWECSVHTIRSSLVSALGHVVFKESGLMGCSEKGVVDDERSLRFQNRALGILMERFLDVSPYTRARTFGVWTMLVQSKVIPIDHYVPLAEAGYRHLSDKAASVQKAAITLLKAMLEYNPFSADLRTWRFKNTLEAHRKRLAEMESDTDRKLALTQGQGEDEQESQMPGATNLEQLRVLEASLEVGFEFSQLIEKSLAATKQILMGPSTLAAQEAIELISTCANFEIEGLDDAVRTMLTLIFSMDKSIQSKVIDAFTDIHIDSPDEDSENPRGSSGDPLVTANNLIGLTVGATVEEMVSLDEMVKHLCKRGCLPDSVAMSLILISNRYREVENDTERNCPPSPKTRLVESKRARGAIQILTMGIDQWRPMLVGHVDAIIQIFHVDDVDGVALEYACTLLKEINIDSSKPSSFKSVIGALLSVILNDNMPDSSWYGASTAAVDALVTLSARPDLLGMEILQNFEFLGEHFQKVDSLEEGPEMGENGGVDMDGKSFTQALSRYFFIGGHVALKTMVWFERAVTESQQKKQKSEGTANRRRRSTALKDGKRTAGGDRENEDDMDGSTMANWKTLELLEKLKKEWTNPGSLIGNCAARVSKFCLNLDRLLASPPVLVGSALMSLTKFMAISATYCEQHVRLIFTLFRKSEIALSTRQNFIVSIQDFVRGFPNVMDAWMEHIYSLLDDPNPEFRQDCLQALAHLMLSNMIKAKGAVGKVALLLQDENPETANMAKDFFAQLAKRTVRNVNPITNLLPEILSNLLRDNTFAARSFQPAIRQLLQYTGSDKSSERLIEKLCQTLKSEKDEKIWRGLMYTLRMMTMTEKGMRNFMELRPCYAHTLGDNEVLSDLTERIAKSKRSAKSGEFKTALEEFEETIKTISGELVAERAARQAENHGMEEDEIDENEEVSDGSEGGGDLMDGVGGPSMDGPYSGQEGPSQADEANPRPRPMGSPTISLAGGIAHTPRLNTSNPAMECLDEEEGDGMSIDSPVALPEEGVVTERLGRMSLTPPPLRDD